MRIVIVSGPFSPLPPAPTCAAVERIWQRLAEQFAEAGNQVTMFCRTHPTQGRDETINGVHYVRRTRFSRTGSTYSDLIFDLFYAARMVPLLPESDIIVTFCFWAPVLIRPWFTSYRSLVVHSQRYPKHQMWLYLHANRISTVSSAIADAIANQSPRAKRLTRVIANPVDTEVFRPPSTPRAIRSPRTILFTGRIHPEKGVHLLVRAVASLNRESMDIQLRLVGPTSIEDGGGGKRYIDELNSLAGDTPLDVPGPIYDPAGLAEALREADYYCYPSLAAHGEASPVAPLEAMATGLPTVVSNLTQFKDYLKDGENGLAFDHRGPNAHGQLASTLRRLLTDNTLSARLGDAAAQTATRFSYAKIAAAYLDDFEQLLRDCPEVTVQDEP